MGRGEDQGFTLLETVVALTVLAVGIVGVVSVFGSSMTLTVHTSQRTRATSLATQFIESFRSKPYSSVTADPTGSTTTTSTVVAGTSYTISGGVTPGTFGTDTSAFKRVTVQVAWTDGAAVHTVQQASDLYPTLATTSTTATGGIAPAAPTALIATVPTGAQGTTGIDLTWTPPAVRTNITGWRIGRSIDGWATHDVVVVTNTPNAFGFHVTQLSAGTTYAFRVASSSASGLLSAWSPIASATTTAAAAGTPCQVTAVRFSPSPVKRSQTRPSALVTAPWVAVDTIGTCVGLHAIYHPTPTTTSTIALVNAAGGVWRAQLLEAPPASWSLGDHDVDVFDQLENKLATGVLRVCEWGSTSC